MVSRSRDCGQAPQRALTRAGARLWQALTLLLCSLVCSLVPAATAWAGHYSQAAYSGGSFTAGGQFLGNYALQQNGFWGLSPYGGSSYSGSGTITTTFTWLPDYTGEPAPASVVVFEECNTSGNANAGGASPSTTTDASNALGHATTRTSNTSGMSSSSSASCNGIRYQIVAPKPNGDVEITCNPSASASATTGYPRYQMSASASVNYRASAQPLEVILAGGIGNQEDKRYLIGQRVTATLNNGGLTPTYNWSANGGDPFKNWTADQINGTFTNLGSETDSQFIFYFKTPTPTGTKATVTCAAHLAVPVAGALPANGFDVTVTRDCTVERPSSTFSAYSGSVSLRGAPPNIIKFGGLTIPEYGDDVGIYWQCAVTTPSQYATSGTGGWNFVQLISPGRRRVNNGIPQEMIKNGLNCLDNTYPYEPGPYTSHPGTAGFFNADGTLRQRGDGPYDLLFAGSRELDSVNMQDSFRTWLMYLPPGDGSRYVPLKRVRWYWHGAASRTAPGAWNLTSLPSDCGWDFDGDFPGPPEWNIRLDNADLANYTPVVP